jgi:hypothetical protein
MKRYRHEQGIPGGGKTQFAGIDSVQWWRTYLKQKVAPGFLEDAACKGKYEEIDFFPERGQDTSEAYAVCRECPVRLQCLDLAILNQESDGIWGGIPAARRKKWLKAGTSAPEMIRLYDNEREVA